MHILDFGMKQMCMHTYLEKYYDLAGASRGKQRGRTEDSI